MAEQEWTENSEVPVDPSAPVVVPWAPAIDKDGKEVAAPKMVGKDGKEYNRPDIVDSNQPVRKFTFTECKAQDTLVRKRIRAEKLKREEAVKKHMALLDNPTVKKP